MTSTPYSAYNAVTALNAQVGEMEAIETEMVVTMNATLDIATEMMLRLEGTNRGEQADAVADTQTEFRRIMSEQVQMQNDVRRFKSALIKVVSQLQDMEDVPEEFEDIFKETYKSLPEESDVENNVRYKELLKMFSELGDTVIPETQANESSELVMMELSGVPLDPITLKRVEDPVRNTFCKHVYERATIMAHIERRHGGCKCPSVGCPNDRPLLRAHLEEHEELRGQLRRDKVKRNLLCL